MTIFRCFECPVNFKTKFTSRYVLHQNAHSKMQGPRLLPASDKTKERQIIAKFVCFQCGERFSNNEEFKSHIKKHRKFRPSYKEFCYLCGQSFLQQKLLEFHINSVHRCNFCLFESASNDVLKSHQLTHLRTMNQIGGKRKLKCFHPFKETKAFNGFLKTYRHFVKAKKNLCSIDDYFNLYIGKISNILLNSLANHKSIKFQVSIHCEFIRENVILDEIAKEVTHHYVNSDLRVALNKYHLPRLSQEIISQLKHSVELFEKNGSGWQLNKIIGCDIRISEFILLKGGCHAEVPKMFSKKRAIVNPVRAGNMCFLYSFLIQMHYDEVPKNHRGSIKQYDKFKHIYNFEDIKFPTTIRQIQKFEKKNELKQFAVNIWAMDSSNKLNIKYQSIFCRETERKFVNLLFVDSESSDIGHYMTITHITRLLGKHNNHLRQLCYNCFSTFSPEGLKSHHDLCFQFKQQRVKMPSKNPTCYFKDFHKRLKSRYVIYADLESLNVKSNTEDRNSKNIINEHYPSGYCLAISDSYAPKSETIKYSLYRGENAMNKFLEELYSVSSWLLNQNENKLPMKPLTKKQLKDYQKNNYCHICELKIRNISEKVKDHCHVTGKYRNPAHHSCNAKYSQPAKIPVIMHSFKTFDSQLLLSNISNFPDESVDVIPNNSEKFLSIITSKFYFVDSLMHLSASLAKLVENLNPMNSSRKVFHRNFEPLVNVFGKKKAKELARKGVFPYEWSDSFKKFDESSFPKRKHFYNSLTSSLVEKEDYNYGKNIFQKYCINMGEYHDLYLLTDTILLMCVMENWRKVARRCYGLEPVLYYSLPGFAWDAALFSSKQTLELITDQNMYSFLELGLRGGVSMVSHRSAKSNNKYMKSCNQAIAKSFILYIDKTQLYAEALSEYLPVGDFKWESDEFVKTLSKDDILKWKPKSKKGYILSVDLEYDKTLHDLSAHSEYPLCPEKIAIPKENLSEYQLNLLDKLNINYSEKQKKLIPHLGNRTNYVTHYRNLQFYLRKGLKLKRVNAVISFTQKPWLKEFVLYNSRLRKEAGNEFEKALFKLIVNATFGKSMQQVRNKEDVKIVSSLEKVKKFTRQANFKRFQILTPSLVIIFRRKPTVLLDKPIFTAFTVLDISKLFMYEWHYNKIKKWYSELKSRLLFTDTDSLAYQIETSDLYSDLSAHAHLFDFSGYDQSHPASGHLYSSVNKGLLGSMKDEAQGKLIHSFVGIAPKMYSLKGEEGLNKSASKGIKKSLAKRCLSHDKFQKALFEQRKFFCRSNLIRSKNHKLYTGNFRKVALHCFDSKRYILDDGISSRAHFHYANKKQQNQ